MNDAPNPVNFEGHILRFHVPVLFVSPIAIMSVRFISYFVRSPKHNFTWMKDEQPVLVTPLTYQLPDAGVLKTAQDIRNVVEYFVCSALAETSCYFSRRLMKHLIDLGTRLMIRSSRPLDSSEGSGEKDQPIS